VDLHRKSPHVAVLADDGEVLASRSIRSRPEEFLRVFGELGPAPLEVAFEATYGWGCQWPSESLHWWPTESLHPQLAFLLAPPLDRASFIR
jgi:hypothetical protein